MILDEQELNVFVWVHQIWNNLKNKYKSYKWKPKGLEQEVLGNYNLPTHSSPNELRI